MWSDDTKIKVKFVALVGVLLQGGLHTKESIMWKLNFEATFKNIGQEVKAWA